MKTHYTRMLLRSSILLLGMLCLMGRTSQAQEPKINQIMSVTLTPKKIVASNGAMSLMVVDLKMPAVGDLNVTITSSRPDITSFSVAHDYILDGDHQLQFPVVLTRQVNIDIPIKFTVTIEQSGSTKKGKLIAMKQ